MLVYAMLFALLYCRKTADYRLAILNRSRHAALVPLQARLCPRQPPATMATRQVKETVDSLRAAMIGAGIIVDSSVRPGWKWMKEHTCEVISFFLIAIAVILVGATYHGEHGVGQYMDADPKDIEKLVKDNAPCAGTMHAQQLTHITNSSGTYYFYECHAIELTASSWFAGFVLLVSLVLMVRNYPADLVMLAATLIMFIGGVIPAEKGT